MTYLSGCCKANMTQSTRLDGKPLKKPFNKYSEAEQNRITFFHYCDKCGQPTRPIDWIKLL